MADKAYALDRLRRIQKTIAFAASGTDFMTVSGPFDQVIIGIRGTTDAHTVDALGMWRSIARIQIQSSKRGQIGDMSGVDLGIVSRGLFNSPAPTDTVGGSAGDGFEAILPVSADADEMLTFTYDFGTLAQIASTGDLAGYTATLRMTAKVIPNNPPTYWGYRSQDIGAAGVLGVAATSQQPQIPTIPGFSLVGFGTVTQNTALTTALINNLDQLRLTKGQDYIVDDFVSQLRAEASRRFYGSLAVGYTMQRHVPVEVTGDTLCVVINGGTATIAVSRIVYIYQTGLLSKVTGTTQTAPVVPGGAQAGGVAPPQATPGTPGPGAPTLSFGGLFGRR